MDSETSLGAPAGAPQLFAAPRGGRVPQRPEAQRLGARRGRGPRGGRGQSRGAARRGAVGGGQGAARALRRRGERDFKGI